MGSCPSNMHVGSRRDSAVGVLQFQVTKLQALWRGFNLRRKGAQSVLFDSPAKRKIQAVKQLKEELAQKQIESKPKNLKIESWNRFNTHAKLLYLVSLYAVEGRKGQDDGAWIRSMALDVLIYECVVQGALRFDYAPQSVRISQPGGTSRRVWLNISQEGRVCIDELRERGLLIALKAMTEDLQPLTCLQVSKKGLSLLKKVPRVVLVPVDNAIHRSSGHASKRGELLQVAWDPENAVFNLRGTLSKRTVRISGCTEPEDVSYCSSPYLPRCLWTNPKLKLHSNARIAAKKLKGSVDSVDAELDEACFLSDVCVMVMEWIPFGENQMYSANERLGAVERNKTNMFTRLIDNNPTDTSFTTAETLTRVSILDYDTVNHVNFEANIFAPMPEGVIQIEHFGVSLRTDGTVMFGLFIDGISSHGRDHVSLDFLSRLLVDVITDSSVVMNDILTPYQTGVMNLTYRGDSLARQKYALIVARKMSPKMSASDFIANDAIHNELRQVIGDVMGAKPLDKQEKDIIVIGRNGLLLIGPSSKQHETVLYYYGALCAREMFIRSLFIRTYLLSLSLAKTREYIMKKNENPHNVDNARYEFSISSKAVVMVDQILDYLSKSIEKLENPVKGIKPGGGGGDKTTRKVTSSGALQQFSMPLMKALNVFDDGLPHDIRLRIKDMKKTVAGVMGTLEILRITMKSVKVQASQDIAGAIESNFSKLIDASRADERGEAAAMVMEIILGGSMAMDLLDRLWAGEFNLDDQSNWIVKLRDWVITIPLVWLGINIFAMLVFVLWLTNYMHKLEEATYGALTTRILVEKVVKKKSLLRKFVGKRSKIKKGFQWSDCNNGIFKLCWEEKHKTFGKGKACKFVMTYDLKQGIVYGINVNVNLRHCKTGERGVLKYIQKMFRTELEIKWNPVKLMSAKTLKRRAKAKVGKPVQCV